MCFSATASFTAGAALTAVGGLTVHKSKGKMELPLALVPLLFGIQQLTEGVLWLSLGRDLPTVTSVASGPMQACRTTVVVPPSERSGPLARR